MNKYTRIIAGIAAIVVMLGVCGCKKVQPQDTYEKENAAGTGYGTGAKSSLYIDDFYFIAKGTSKANIELLVGSAHYHDQNSEFSPVYTLSNGDTIALTYDTEKKTVTEAKYKYAEEDKEENFFDILVGLGILESPVQERPGSTTTDIPSGNDSTGLLPPVQSDPDTSDSNGSEDNLPTQNVGGGAPFAMGMYDVSIAKSNFFVNQSRAEVIYNIGKPNYFFSHSFSQDSYIIDCYNLSDGSKLYIDYGYERSRLRSVAIYKNGTYTTVIDVPWQAQSKPDGFTRLASEESKISRLKKNMTPSNVYTILGEPSWYEGTRASYNDVFLLSDGSYAILNFGSAHNKLTTLSIKGADGKLTVMSLK